MFQQQKAAPIMAYSPSLRTEDQKSSVQSGWVSLPSGKAHKSFVGSVNRDDSIISGSIGPLLVRPEAKDDMDCSDDQPGQPSVKNKCVEEKRETPMPSIGNFLARGAMVAAGVVIPVRFYGALTTVTYSSGVATTKLAWNPLAIGEFATFADLFSEYKLKRVVTSVWFANSDTTLAIQLKPDVFIIGSDPGSVVTGTPTSAISNLSKSQRWNTLQTNKSAPIHGANCAEAPVAPKSSGGYVSIVTPWTGQTCMFAQSGNSAAGTNISFLYQAAYELEFRSRY
jgi:hypothetical protein